MQNKLNATNVLTKKIVNYKPHEKFTSFEDQMLRYWVSYFGEQKWRQIAKFMKNRTSRQCRERWKYYLSPSINREPFTQAEDQMILECVEKYGTRWMPISKLFNNRTDAMIKNRYNQLQRMKRNEINDIPDIQSFDNECMILNEDFDFFIEESNDILSDASFE